MNKKYYFIYNDKKDKKHVAYKQETPKKYTHKTLCGRTYPYTYQATVIQIHMHLPTCLSCYYASKYTTAMNQIRNEKQEENNKMDKQHYLIYNNKRDRSHIAYMPWPTQQTYKYRTLCGSTYNDFYKKGIHISRKHTNTELPICINCYNSVTFDTAFQQIKDCINTTTTITSKTSNGPKEEINHPSHYGGDTTYEVIKVIEAWGLDTDFLLGNVVKYIARANKKDDVLKDLKKALWYLERKICNVENN